MTKKMKTPVILLRSLNVDRGGITKAVLKRVNMFAENYKNVIIVTTLFQRKHKEIINELRQRGELQSNVIVYNFFEELRNQRPKPFFRRRVKHSTKEKNYEKIRIKNHPEKSFRYYKDGFYKMYKRFKDNDIEFIDYMDKNGQRLYRSEYDENGLLVRKRFMDIALNKPRFDKYFDFKEECMLSTHINPLTGKERIVVHFDDEPVSYNSLHLLQAKWLNKLLRNISQPVLFNELRGLDNIVYRVKHPKIKKVAVTHSSHLKEPYDDIEELRPVYQDLFDKDKYNQYVFLTKNQKEDVETIFGNNDEFIIIPHTYNTSIDSLKDNGIEKNAYLIVCIARYADDKRIDEAIYSFRHVVDQEPKAQLYIYGNGPLEGELKNLIKKLGLEKNVFLKGYTNNPSLVYQSAICSIITSRREGFGLVMIESMSAGTPVVAYDFKYGPRDIITNEKDGFIVENGNREQLAEKIINIIRNPNLRKTLSENALSVRDRFSESSYKRKWLDLLK